MGELHKSRMSSRAVKLRARLDTDDDLEVYRGNDPHSRPWCTRATVEAGPLRKVPVGVINIVVWCLCPHRQLKIAKRYKIPLITI